MQRAVLKTRLDPKRSWTYLELTGSVFWTVFPNPVSHFQSMDGFTGFPLGFSHPILGSKALVVRAIGVVVATPVFLPVSAILVIVAAMNMIPIACAKTTGSQILMQCQRPPRQRASIFIPTSALVAMSMRPVITFGGLQGISNSISQLWNLPAECSIYRGNEWERASQGMHHTWGFQESSGTASALRQAAIVMMMVVVMPFIGNSPGSFQPNRLGQGFHRCWRGSWLWG